MLRVASDGLTVSADRESTISSFTASFASGAPAKSLLLVMSNVLGIFLTQLPSVNAVLSVLSVLQASESSLPSLAEPRYPCASGSLAESECLLSCPDSECCRVLATKRPALAHIIFTPTLCEYVFVCATPRGFLHFIKNMCSPMCSLYVFGQTQGVGFKKKPALAVPSVFAYVFTICFRKHPGGGFFKKTCLGPRTHLLVFQAPNTPERAR